MLPMNDVQQSEETPVTQQRILQLHSKTIKFDLRPQYVKLNLIDELRRYDEEHGEGVDIQDGLPNILTSSTENYGQVNNVYNNDVQERYRGLRDSWEPRRQNVKGVNESNSQLFPYQTSYVEDYDNMYGSPVTPDHHQPMSNKPASTESPDQYSSSNGTNYPAESYQFSTGYQNMDQVSPQPMYYSPPMLVYPTIFNPQLALLWVHQYPGFFQSALANIYAQNFPPTQYDYENTPPQHEYAQLENASKDVSIRNETTEKISKNDGDLRTESLLSELSPSMEVKTVDDEAIPKVETFQSGSENSAPTQNTPSSCFNEGSISKEKNASTEYGVQSSTESISASNLDNELALRELELVAIDDCKTEALETAGTTEEVQKTISKRSLTRSARRERQRERENQFINEKTVDKLPSSFTTKSDGLAKSDKKQKLLANVTADKNQSPMAPVSKKSSKQNKTTSKVADSVESSSNTESGGVNVKSKSKLSKSKRKALEKKERGEKRMTNEKPRQKSGSFGTGSSKSEDEKNEERELTLENSAETEHTPPVVAQPEEQLRHPRADEQQILAERIVAENVGDGGIAEIARAEQRLKEKLTQRMSEWIRNVSAAFPNKPINWDVAISMLVYSDAMIGFRIPYAIWHSKYARNDHLAFDGTKLLGDIMDYTTNNPLAVTNSSRCAKRSEEFLRARVKAYENSNDENGQTLYVLFKTIHDFKPKNFFIQDLMYLSSVADDEKQLQIDDKYSTMFGNVLKYHLTHLQVRYSPSHSAFGDLPISVDERVGSRFLAYLETQYKLRVRFVFGEQEVQKLEKSFTPRQLSMLDLFRKTDLSEGKWTARDSEKFLVFLLISALNLPKSNESRQIVHLYRFLLLIQSTVLDIDLFMYSNVFHIEPFNCSIAKHKFILNPWFNI